MRVRAILYMQALDVRRLSNALVCETRDVILSGYKEKGIDLLRSEDKPKLL